MRTDTPYRDTREHLLDTGEAVFRGKGFAAVGLAEILGEAGVPKGSFYHYFKSKEAYGVDMLVRYFQRYEVQSEALLFREGVLARDCLMDYFQLWSRHDGRDCQQSCLAVKLSGEVSDLSEPMRVALVAGMKKVQAGLARTIRAGQADGSLAAVLEPEALAASLYTLWVGAELLAKVQRSSAPLQQALRQTQAMLVSP